MLRKCTHSRMRLEYISKQRGYFVNSLSLVPRCIHTGYRSLTDVAANCSHKRYEYFHFHRSVVFADTPIGPSILLHEGIKRTAVEGDSRWNGYFTPPPFPCPTPIQTATWSETTAMLLDFRQHLFPCTRNFEDSMCSRRCASVVFTIFEVTGKDVLLWKLSYFTIVFEM